VCQRPVTRRRFSPGNVCQIERWIGQLTWKTALERGTTRAAVESVYYDSALNPLNR